MSNGLKYLRRSFKWPVLAGLTIFGVSSIGGAAESFRVANTPQRRLAPLTEVLDLSASYPNGPPFAVKDGETVHVEGILRGEPARRGNGGGLYALQKVRVQDSLGSASMHDATPRLWLHVDPESEPGEAGGRVEVRLPPSWTGEQIKVRGVHGTVDGAGALPDNVAAILAPTSSGMPRQVPGQKWTVWAIEDGEPVVVVSRARHEGGRVVLAPARGERCIVSDRPWPSLLGDANIWGAVQLCLALGCLSPWALAARKYLRRPR